MKISLNRVDDAFNFEATNEDGKIISIDAASAIGGKDNGVRPMQLVIMGLGGCSAIDVINILKKQKQEIEGFTIDIQADRFENVEPSLFEKIHIEFKLEGASLSEKKELRAVGLSMDKYCSVSAILEKTAKITYDSYLNGVKLND